MNKKIVLPLIAFVSLMLFLSASSSSNAATDYTHGDFLVDYGNGNTQWIETDVSSTISETVIGSLNEASISCTISGGVITIDGLISRSTGATDSGGSVSTAGTTGVTVNCSWKIYSWSNNQSKWVILEPSEWDDAYSMHKLAVGFYPDGMVPTVNPNYKTAWTMFAGDAENSVNQKVEDTSTGSIPIWHTHGDGAQMSAYGCYCGTLYANGMAIVKTGSLLTSYNVKTGDIVWKFTFKSTQIEMSCPVIAGDKVYVPATNGHIYGFSIKDGPGAGNSNVFEADVIPETTIELEYHASYGQGPTAMVYSSGCIFVKAHNGMVYCFDSNLKLVWSYQMLGQAYYTPVTVIDDYVLAGTYDGCMYILDRASGALIHKEVVFQTTDLQGNKVGACNTPSPIRYSDGFYIIATYSDGQGMNSTISSIMLYKFETSTNTLTKVKDFVDQPDLGFTCNMVTRYVTDDFKGIILASDKGISTIDVDGNQTFINKVVAGSRSTHATPTLVNNEFMYISTYGSQEFYELSTSGEILGKYSFDNKWYAMAIVTVVDGFVVRSDDNGVTAFSGSKLDEYTPPVFVEPMPLWEVLLIILVVVIAIIAVIWAVLKFGKKWDKPFAEIHRRVMVYFFGENYSHNTKSKRKLHAVIAIGICVTAFMVILSLCVGSKTTMGVGEALSNAASAIGKGGRNLTYEEMLIYNQRLPRAFATVAVGIGLSVAGAMYQAVIKNPLVEPYIMGVSSGAGTLAVAVILADFTFFGLFQSQSIYLTAISAIVGGLLAFGCTMLMAVKTGGKSINYVLAGIVVGLVFSAIQSILMIQSGTKMANALSWLYGSFASMTWDKLWLVLVPCIALSMVPLIWAKELNLVLLGEDQAMQMGLNAKRFDRLMLIVASVLTSFCVAFCGIIGFVGLVVPHLARMIMGGDHRLMLPVSMAFGGSLMILSDLLARVLMSGYELPVGAVTTIIGVPVFAYLLIRSGGRYDA